jgi:hypothetical protein
MTPTRSTEAQTELAEQPMATPPGGFGAEFRELARQRRFVREEAPTSRFATAARASAPAPAPAAQVPAPAMPAAPTQATRATSSLRMSDDHRAMLAELARMSDRLVESREALAHMSARATHLETEVAAANDRLMAARALVHDAQQATRASAERCAWLEGRCETLQEALDVAVHASLYTRWKWRRQARGRA